MNQDAKTDFLRHVKVALDFALEDLEVGETPPQHILCETVFHILAVLDNDDCGSENFNFRLQAVAYPREGEPAGEWLELNDPDDVESLEGQFRRMLEDSEASA